MTEEKASVEEAEEDEVALGSFVDQKARNDINSLRKRLEGAHLVPSFGVLVKKMFQSIISWSGWEMVGITGTFLGGLTVIVLVIFFIGKGCDNHNQTLTDHQTEQEREQYAPACQALELEFASVQRIYPCSNGECESVVEHIVCVGQDRVVTVNTRNPSLTEVHMIENE